MVIHKWKNNTNSKRLCNATDYKKAIISNHWMPVNCKNCKTIKRVKPKLTAITRQIATYERQLKKLKHLEGQYQGELSNAFKETNSKSL